jgi:hypothetical protein
LLDPVEPLAELAVRHVKEQAEKWREEADYLEELNHGKSPSEGVLIEIGREVPCASPLVEVALGFSALRQNGDA